jgi:lysozyme
VNDTLQLSAAGAALIKSFEACMDQDGPDQYRAYTCPAGVLTIGWGHTNAFGRSFGAGDVWTAAECDAAFDADMGQAEASVRRLVEVPLTQGQFDALVSFAYNCGAGNLAGSTLLKLLNQGDYEGAALEFPKWTHGAGKVLPGLVRRRAAEALMFQDALPQDGVPPSLIAAADTATPRAVTAYAGAFA